MKSFNEYIYTNMFLFESETSSNKERKKELEKWLKGKRLNNYVDALNKMIEDPKAKTLLQDGFGGELGDAKLKFQVLKLPVRNLRPSQSEIDVEKSIKHSIENPNKIDNLYKKGKDDVMINFPIITFRKNYVIDGHHRWAEIFALNPDAKAICCDYDGDISPIQMLKVTQGAIAAVKADETNKNNGELPVSHVKGQNLFDDEWDKEKIIDYIKKKANSNLVNALQKYHNELDDMDKVAEWIADNLIELKYNNYPEYDDIDRGIMPQTSKGGTDIKDPESSRPDHKGSALNKLKDGEFLKNAIK